jgi:hypothetical protein
MSQPINRIPSGIPATKIADGTVTDAEFQRLGTVTGPLIETSGTPVVGQVPVFASATALTGIRKYVAQLSHGTYANGTLITLPFLAAGNAADGDYYVRVVRRATSATTLTIAEFSFVIASNALSGTPVCASGGTSLNATPRAGVSGGAVVLHLNATIAANIYVEVYTTVATAGGAFALSDVAATGTACTTTNAVAALTASSVVVGTDPGGSALLRVGGGSRLSGSVQLQGTGVGFCQVTSDGSDNAELFFNGGGAEGNTRGGGLQVYGNEHATTPGDVVVEAGNVTGGDLILKVAATEIHKINRDKSVTLDATYAASLLGAFGPGIAGLTSKATPVTNDDFLISDSAASDVAKRVTYGDLLTTLTAAIGGSAFSEVYAYKTSNQGSIGTGYTKITFDSERFDTGSNFASSTFTAPSTQKYLFESIVTVGNDTAGNLLALVYYVDGTRSATTRRESGLTTAFPRIFQIVNSQVLSLTSGQTVDLYLYNSANTCTVYGVGVDSDTGLTSIRVKPLGA